VKIIEPGRAQHGWSVEATCTGAGNGRGGCGAKLLVEESDLYRTQSQARDETTYYTTFKCVACGVETDIDVPSSVASRLRDKPRPGGEGAK
jgi:hypothetical protein